MVCDQSEQRRHKSRSHISTCHLDTDDRLGVLLSEIGRCCMDDRWINRCTAKSHNNQTNSANSSMDTGNNIPIHPTRMIAMPRRIILWSPIFSVIKPARNLPSVIPMQNKDAKAAARSAEIPFAPTR